MRFWYELKFINRDGQAWVCVRQADMNLFTREVLYGEFATVSGRLRYKCGSANVRELYSPESNVLLRAVCCEVQLIADFGLPTHNLAQTPV